MPAVQCKDTLLLDYDYHAQYSKRKLESNADRYKELPSDDDNDDENGQLTAADFQQLLTASKSIGDHFTFAAERSWLSNDDDANATTHDASSMASDLFKLNISNLKNGLDRIPFYIRQGLPIEIFTEQEITDMNYRANFFENGKLNQNQSTLAKQQPNQNLLNILKSNSNSSSNENVNSSNATAKVNTHSVGEKLSEANIELDELLKDTRISDTPIKMTSISSTIASNSIPKAPTKPSTVAKPSKTTPNKTEDIQDWLDDILNE